MNAHFNVEVCASVKSVKYLYKYVYKGYDAGSARMEKKNSPGVINHDEILTFLDGRYIIAPEVMLRINEFATSEKSHTIIRLAVHLPEQQQVFYKDGQEDLATARACMKETMLTAWFKLNQSDEQANNYTYTHIPNHGIFL